MGKIHMSGASGGVMSDDVTASRADVLKGKKTITTDSNDEVVEGLIEDRGQAQTAGGWGNGTDYYAMNNIPEGLYRKNGAAWAPEVRLPMNMVRNALNASNRANWRASVSIAHQTGTMPEQGGSTTVPGTANKTIVAANRFVNGNIIVSGDPNLKAANIKKNQVIFGVKGTFEGWVPTPQDLYYNGVNIAGFKFPQNQSSVWKEENNRLANYVGSANIQFTKSIDVTTYSKLIIEGRLHAQWYSYDSHYSDIKVGISKYAASNYSEKTFDGVALVTSVTLNIEHVSTIGVDDLIRFSSMRNADEFAEPPEEPNIITRIRLE